MPPGAERGGDAPLKNTHDVTPTEEAWVSRERSEIAEARANKIALMEALGLSCREDIPMALWRTLVRIDTDWRYVG